MPVLINVLDLEDPNLIGEALRAHSFRGQGLGAYDTFTLRPEFRPLAADPADPTAFRLLRLMTWRDTAAEIEAYIGEFGAPELFSDGSGIEVGWHWDGDGTLAFAADGRLGLVTTDCKHVDEWRVRPLDPAFLEPRHAVLGRRRPDEIAQLGAHPEAGRHNAGVMGLELLSRSGRAEIDEDSLVRLMLAAAKGACERLDEIFGPLHDRANHHVHAARLVTARDRAVERLFAQAAGRAPGGAAEAAAELRRAP